MPGRKRRARCIGFDPGFLCFKPCGRPGRGLESVTLRADELEALRLADLEGLYQEECAVQMGISRTTLSRTLAQARRKVTDALISGKRLVVEPPREKRGVEGVRCGAVVPSDRPEDETGGTV
ncbi:DUF134 domain-containing protein [Thiocapsa bogorovii]|uniref:DUF134 domain-containing protein n=1 Tax=Thiocapsa bogorovii TaxID=521689 RepID=UPI001E3E28B1|nr:DUF134 domain-containing protein [Thiocapsa bogorovii]UHD17222.1 DUF134 domain-containing protein [Thiocapsa bogorovii]